MKAGFEKVFSEIQTDMVAICMEYVEDRADEIYIYASREEKIISCDFFYKINGQIYKRHRLPEGYDVSIQRQAACMKILIGDMRQLVAACKEYEAEMQKEIKIIYDVKNNKLNASYKYENVYAGTEKTANDIADEWFEEICKKNEK